MQIRKLTIGDQEQLNALMDVIETTLPDRLYWLPVKETAKAHFFDDEWTEFYGMFDGERLVGAAALFYNEYEYGESLRQLNLPPQPVAEIGRAMVHPDYRGNNVLYRINQKLVEVAAEKGIRLLLATIYPSNMPSQKSFARLGMKKQCTYIKGSDYVRDILTMQI